jgi:chaperonin cofactor prefoldin
MTVEIPANAALKLFGRPGESAEQFETRCARAADELADAEIAALRGKYEAKVTRLRDQIAAAEDRIDVLAEEASSKRNSELLSTAGSILGGLLGGRSRGGLLGKLGGAARRRGSTKAAHERVDAVENKVERLQDQLEDLEAELAEEVTEIDARWMDAAKAVTPMQVGLEKTDINVTQLVLAWVPVA